MAGEDKTSIDKSRPWVEKYRPKTLADVSAQDEVVSVLRNSVNTKNLPHLMFYGPPGTGKTSTILALANELFGPKLLRNRVLELNASDERGISVVREKIKNFAKVTVTQTDPDYPCPPFKIIVLDEADSMTAEAQSALRRTMETYALTTRFCLICNYSSRIIPPLVSRCAKFRFKPLPLESIAARLSNIADKEGVHCSPETVAELVAVSDGDLRRSVMLLQSASRATITTTGQTRPLNAEDVRELAGQVPQEVIKSIMNAWKAQDFDEIFATLKMAVREGYSGAQLIVQLTSAVAEDPHLSSIKKARMGVSMATAEKSLTDGSDEQLQLLSMLTRAF